MCKKQKCDPRSLSPIKITHYTELVDVMRYLVVGIILFLVWNEWIPYSEYCRGEERRRLETTAKFEDQMARCKVRILRQEVAGK